MSDRARETTRTGGRATLTAGDVKWTSVVVYNDGVGDFSGTVHARHATDAIDVTVTGLPKDVLHDTLFVSCDGKPVRTTTIPPYASIDAVLDAMSGTEVVVRRFGERAEESGILGRAETRNGTMVLYAPKASGTSVTVNVGKFVLEGELKTVMPWKGTTIGFSAIARDQDARIVFMANGLSWRSAHRVTVEKYDSSNAFYTPGVVARVETDVVVSNETGMDIIDAHVSFSETSVTGFAWRGASRSYAERSESAPHQSMMFSGAAAASSKNGDEDGDDDGEPSNGGASRPKPPKYDATSLMFTPQQRVTVRDGNDASIPRTTWYGTAHFVPHFFVDSVGRTWGGVDAELWIERTDDAGGSFVSGSVVTVRGVPTIRGAIDDPVVVLGHSTHQETSVATAGPAVLKLGTLNDVTVARTHVARDRARFWISSTYSIVNNKTTTIDVEVRIPKLSSDVRQPTAELVSSKNAAELVPIPGRHYHAFSVTVEARKTIEVIVRRDDVVGRRNASIEALTVAASAGTRTADRGSALATSLLPPMK